MTYTVFGGGDSVEFTIDTNKKVTLVASLGFGGAAAIDLVIAKGVIQAMVGIEFRLQDGKAELAGFVRIYGCVEILELIAISVEILYGTQVQAAIRDRVGIADSDGQSAGVLQECHA